jgi:hypothetical protein
MVKTFLTMLSILFCGAIFISIFVFVASFVAILSEVHFQDFYGLAVLILDSFFFTIIMVLMIYTMDMFERLIDYRIQ